MHFSPQKFFKLRRVVSRFPSHIVSEGQIFMLLGSTVKLIIVLWCKERRKRRILLLHVSKEI